MLSGQEKSSVRTEIELPPGFQGMVIAPKSGSFDAPAGGGKVRMTSSTAAGKFVLTDDFETSPVIIINPHDYPAMLKMESALEKKSSDVFLLEKE